MVWTDAFNKQTEGKSLRVFYVIGLVLHHISIYKPTKLFEAYTPKKHGFATLLLVASSIFIGCYCIGSYENMKNVSNIVSLNSAITGRATKTNIYCGASYYCQFFQEEECEPSKTIYNGEVATLSSDECTWTAVAITNPSAEEIGGASLALYLDSPERVGAKILQPMVYTTQHDTELYIHMTKTEDDHGTSIEHETWYIVPLIDVDNKFKPCEKYKEQSIYNDAICIGLKIFINTNTYKVYYDANAAFVYTLTKFVVLTTFVYVFFRILLTLNAWVNVLDKDYSAMYQRKKQSE